MCEYTGRGIKSGLSLFAPRPLNIREMRDDILEALKAVQQHQVGQLFPIAASDWHFLPVRSLRPLPRTDSLGCRPRDAE